MCPVRPSSLLLSLVDLDVLNVQILCLQALDLQHSGFIDTATTSHLRCSGMLQSLSDPALAVSKILTSLAYHVDLQILSLHMIAQTPITGRCKASSPARVA